MTPNKRQRFTLTPEIYQILEDFAREEGHNNLSAALATIVKFGSQHLRRCNHCTNSSPTESNRGQSRPPVTNSDHQKPTSDQQRTLEDTTGQQTPQEPTKSKASAAFDRLNKRLNGGLENK